MENNKQQGTIASPIYNFLILLYANAIHFASLFHKKAKLMIEGHKNTWQILSEKIDPSASYIWLHAASLGEFEQGRPIIEKIKKQYPEYKILVTFFSPSGYEVRKNYPLADVICYLPFDTQRNVKRFFALVQPKKALFVKYEFWPNYFRYIQQNGIELYSVASIFRNDQIFFRPYGKQAIRMLDCVSHFFVQDRNSKQLLSSLGIDKNVSIVGDTRFDRVRDIMLQSKPLPKIDTFLKGNGDAKLTMVAGSSWPIDEDIILEHFNTHKEMRLIIAPHEIHEEHIASIIAKLKRPYTRYTKATDEELMHAECLIVDCFGVLSSIYRYGQIAYIGGGFGVGIHNILEAAVYGMPVVFGPNFKKFREAHGMLEAKGGFSIASATEYNKLMNGFLDSSQQIEEAGRNADNYVKSNLGATDQVINSLSL